MEELSNSSTLENELFKDESVSALDEVPEVGDEDMLVDLVRSDSHSSGHPSSTNYRTSARKHLVGFLQDSWVILRNGFPLILSNIGRYSVLVTDVIFLGHIDDGTGGEVSLAAAATASSWINCTWWFFIGVIWSMDSLVSQAQGAGNLPLIGVILQSELFVVTLLALPASVAWWVTGDVMRLFGFSDRICDAAATFARIQLIGILPMHWYRTLLKWLEAQAITKPGFYLNLLGVFINLALNYVLIFGVGGVGGLGFIGSPLATSLMRWILAITLAIFVMISGLHKPTWRGWSREAVSPKRLLPLLRFGVPAALMLGFEVLAFEIQTLMSGFLGEDEIAAFAVAMNVMLLTAASGVGITSSGAQRVGFYLGEGSGRSASRAAAAALITTFAAQFLLGLLVLVFRHWIVAIFTSNEDVRELSAKMLWAVAIVTIVDGLQSVVGGLLRTAGRPTLGTILLFTGVFAIGTPLSIVTAFVLRWTVYGLWIGLGLGLGSFVVLSFIVLFLFIDWEKESREARLRSEVPEKEIEMDTFQDFQSEEELEDKNSPEVQEQ